MNDRVQHADSHNTTDPRVARGRFAACWWARQIVESTDTVQSTSPFVGDGARGAGHCGVAVEAIAYQHHRPRARYDPGSSAACQKASENSRFRAVLADPGWVSVPAADTVHRTSRGWDGRKRTNGRKRHIAVDVNGLLPAVVTPAAIQNRDVKGREAVSSIRPTVLGGRRRPSPA